MRPLQKPKDEKVKCMKMCDSSKQSVIVYFNLFMPNEIFTKFFRNIILKLKGMTFLNLPVKTVSDSPGKIRTIKFISYNSKSILFILKTRVKLFNLEICRKK